MFSSICVWINDWENNREVGDFRRYRAHYDAIVMMYPTLKPTMKGIHMLIYGDNTEKFQMDQM